MKKVALVTGASRGMGLEWCKQLERRGYTVILTASSLNKAEKAAQSFQLTEGKVIPKQLNVIDESQIQELVNAVEQSFGKLDLLINNAGVNPKDYKDKSKRDKAFNLNSLDTDVMLEVIRINSLAPILIVKNFRRLLSKSSTPKVINISSWLGAISLVQRGGHYGYVGSKNLLNILNKSMSFELKEDNIITVNVNPGWVQTDMGGSKAQLTVSQAVNNMIVNIIEKVKIEHTGQFLNYDGTPHPW